MLKYQWIMILALLSGCQLNTRSLNGNVDVNKTTDSPASTTLSGAPAGTWSRQGHDHLLSDQDHVRMQKTARTSLENGPAGSISSWQNPENGHSGTITPQESFTNVQGDLCREYQQTIRANNQTETGYETACRQNDGSWKIVGQP